MHKHANHNPIYTQSESGLLLETGTVSDFSRGEALSFLRLKETSNNLRSLYEANGLTIHPASHLARLIADTKTLSDGWFCNDESAATVLRLFAASQLDRISTAALPLSVSPKAKRYLRDLLSGNLNLFSRERSKAKDTLWELELWQMMVRTGIAATLEEPDVVASFGDARVGVSCKKFYSEGSVSTVLSKAVSQFEKGFEFGIVAINLDDLVPANVVLKAESHKIATDVICERNFAFMHRHESTLRRYLEPSRALFALVSTSMVVDVLNLQPRFFNWRQSAIWQIPTLPPHKEAQARNFFAAFNSAHS